MEFVAGGNADHVKKNVDGVVAIDAGAVIDVVGADDGAGQLLQEVGFLVRAAGRIQEGNRVGAVLAADLPSREATKPRASSQETL